MQASAFIGRVGGLAVALGIGAAALGAMAPAWAEPTDAMGSAAGSATASDTAAARSIPAAPRSRAGRAAAAKVSSASSSRKNSSPALSSSVGLSAPAPKAQAANTGDLTAVSAAVSTRPNPVAAQAVSSVPAAAATDTTVADPVSTPAAGDVQAAPAAAGAVDSVLGPLGGTTPGGPVEAPLSWVVLAVTRRDPGQGAAMAPAAMVTTGQVPDPLAAVASNQAPVIATVILGAPNASTGAVIGTVKATDANGDKLTYKAVTSTKGTVSITTAGVFTYTPTATARHAAAKIGAASSVTTDTVTVTVTDSKGAATTKAVTVTISPKDAAPVSGTTKVGTPNATTGVVTGSVAATDAEKDTLTYSAPATTAKGSVTVNTSTGAFTYTATDTARNVAGADSFTVTVTDGYGGSTPIVVSVPVSAKAATTAKVTYIFNYTNGAQYWTPEAKAALQKSADQVATYIVVSQPVTLTFDVTAENAPNSDTMASAGSDLTSFRSGIFNTVVQNKILTGVDSNGATADGTIDVNFGTGYAFGDTVSASQYDFKSTMMHEMLHAYGFLSYVDEAGYNTYTQWTKFDSFIGTRSGAKVINTNGYKFNTAYNANLTGANGGLYFLGPTAVAAYGGPVPLYTPSPWSAGSSVSHLDDNTFTGANAMLMNAMAGTGLGIRTLSKVELGILTDLGYTVKQNPVAASMLLFGVFFLRRRRNR